MKESFNAEDRAAMQKAADEITAESRRLVEQNDNACLHAVLITLMAVAIMACVLSAVAEYIAVF